MRIKEIPQNDFERIDDTIVIDTINNLYGVIDSYNSLDEVFIKYFIDQKNLTNSFKSLTKKKIRDLIIPTPQLGYIQTNHQEKPLYLKREHVMLNRYSYGYRYKYLLDIIGSFEGIKEIYRCLYRKTYNDTYKILNPDTIICRINNTIEKYGGLLYAE